MKVIDLFKKIANGEEVPKHIRIGDSSYYYDCSDSDYYNDIENAPSLLERIWRHNAYAWLNLEVEIPKEDEFIDIEELKIGYPEDNPSNKYIVNEYGTKCYLTKHSRIMADKINDLIKNQKKIIERLSNERD